MVKVVKVVCRTANEHHNLDTTFLPQLNGRIRLVASAVESKKISNMAILSSPTLTNIKDGFPNQRLTPILGEPSYATIKKM